MSADSDQLSPVEQLAEEFLQRQQRGEKPTIGEYCEKHPELADEIREVFEALAMMEELKPDSHDATGSFGSSVQSEGKRLERVGDYRILREIGRGGMGVVYEAEQESLRRRVALKVLPRRVAGDEKALQRFQREARAAARMHHTNIVPVFDVGEDEDHVFYAMQMIQGQGLDLVIDDLKRLRTDHVVLRKDAPADPASARQELAERQSLAASLVTGRFHQENLGADVRREEAAGDNGRRSATVESPPRGVGSYAETILQAGSSSTSAVLPGQSQLSTAETNRRAYFRSVAEIGLQTGRALSYAHARGIIHRDIKPSNLLLDAAGVVWVTDFGLAKTSDEAMTHTGDILGTIRYMSPERFKGQCDVRADLYSLGLTLYELLVLRPAFASPDRLRLIELVSSTEPPTPRSIDPRIPRDLETVILKLIDKDPRRRYQSADELCEDLARFIQDEPIKARRVSVAERLVRWSRRNKGLAASLATVGALLLVINIAGPVVTLRMKRLNDDLKFSQRALQGERDAADKRADEMSELARQRDIAALNEKAAAEEARRLTELTRRNLYNRDIDTAHLAGLVGDVTRREASLANWRVTDGTKDLRGWEYYYLLAEGEDRHLEFRSHPGPVIDVACSPDGARFASTGESGEIHLCDLATGEVLRTLTGHSSWVNGLDWSPDGSRLASSGYDQTVRIWDVASGQELLTIRGHDGPVIRLRWDPWGKRVASASVDGTARVWDALSGEQLARFRGDGSYVLNVAWHPDGDRLAIVGFEPVVHVRDVTTGMEVESFEGQSGIILGVDWHPDGVRLATASQRGEFCIWRTGQKEPLQRISGQAGPRVWVRWSPDGRSLALSEPMNRIRIVDAETWQQTAMLRGHPDMQNGLSWCPDSRRLASCGWDGSVRIWTLDDKDSGRRITTGPDVILASDWHPQGRLLATGDAAGVVRLWDADSRTMLRELRDPERAMVAVAAVEFSPDGTQVAAGGRIQNVVLVWESATGRLLHRLQGPPLKQTGQQSGIRALCWDEEQSRLAAGNSDNDVLIWTPRTETLAQTVSGNGIANALCFISGTEGRWLAAGSGAQVRLWDLNAGAATIAAEVPGYVFGLAINSDGTRLAAASGYYGSSDQSQFAGFGSVRLWDIVRRGERVELQNERLLPGPRNVVRSVAFTDDGSRLAAGGVDGDVFVWDATGDLTADVRRQLLVLDNGTDEIRSVQFEAGGVRLAAAGAEVRLWDALPGYARELSPALLPALERKLLSGSADRDDVLLRARILARQGDWTAAAAAFDRLFELGDAAPWYTTDLWVLDGPFPGALPTEFAPERIRSVDQFDVDAPVAGAKETGFPESVHWRPRTLEKNLLIDFGAMLHNRESVAGYALLCVYAPREQEVGIILGTDDRHRLWLNGTLVHENLAASRAYPAEHAVPGVLHRGWNTLLVKVVNVAGAHGLFLSLSDDPEELAPIYAQSNQPEAAEEAWNRVVSRSPDNPFQFINRGNFLWKQGRWEEADRDLERAVQLPEIDEELVRLMRGRVLVQWGRGDAALADFDRALELSPESPLLFIERSLANMNLSRLPAAAADLKAAVALNPTDHWRTYHLTSLLLEAGDEAGYEQLRSDLLARWGNDRSATIAERTCKACLLRPAGDDALKQLDTLMEAARHVSPQHVFYAYFRVADGMLQYRQGEARLTTGDETAARAQFREALRLLESGRAGRLGALIAAHCDLYRAMTLHRLGRTDEAAAALKQAESAMAGASFTQPGQPLPDDGWHDELMPRITQREAVRLIQGPAYEELLEGRRLLSAGNAKAALQRLEAAVAQASDPEQMLPSAVELLEMHRGGGQALLPGGEHGAAVNWQYRFTPPPAGWETGNDQDDSGWSSGPAPFGSYRGNLSPRSPWPQMSPGLWLRARFDVADLPAGPLSIRAYVDDNAEVFINGVLAARGAWVGTKYQQLDVSLESAQAIKPGANVLAVHCTNVNGGGKIDVGLYVGDNRVLHERLLTAALKASPDSDALLQQRGELNVQLERWREAAQDFEKVLELKADANSVDWMKAATLHAMAVSTGSGTLDDYRRVCNRMIERFGTSQENIEIERTMKCCSILSTDVDVSQLPVERVTCPLDDGTLTEKYLIPWFSVACALAEYRRGEFRAADQRASTSLETAAVASGTARDVIRALAATVRSLALSAQDRHDEARIDLDRAREHLAQLVVRRPDGTLVGTSLFNQNGALDHDRLIADMLIREAEGALGP